MNVATCITNHNPPSPARAGLNLQGIMNSIYPPDKPSISKGLQRSPRRVCGGPPSLPTSLMARRRVLRRRKISETWPWNLSSALCAASSLARTLQWTPSGRLVQQRWGNVMGICSTEGLAKLDRWELSWNIANMSTAEWFECVSTFFNGWE